MRKTTLPIETNMLRELHAQTVNLCNIFRDKVCHECGYSVPTFYRKARSSDTKLSNAEKEKIVECFDLSIDKIKESMKKHLKYRF